MDKDVKLEQEFDLVFKAHYSLVKKFALMLLKSGQDADDIAQEVFTRLWAKPQIWQDNPGIDKYIYAMTKHAIFDFLKHKRIERSYQQAQMEENLFKDLSPSDDTLDAIYYKEIRLALQMAVEQFPERRRLIFEMSRLHGMSNLEIAEKLDISVRTVERQIYLSLLELKKNRIYFVFSSFHLSTLHSCVVLYIDSLLIAQRYEELFSADTDLVH